MITIGTTILAINPNAQFRIVDNNLDTIEWLNETTPISKTDIEAKMAELQTAYDNNAYQRVRATAYPTWQEQMDMQYKDLLNGTTTWKDAVAKVKADNPKD
tara:strand:- start:75 stop:377 length:303 start_codon:yes stop_codon:yes gene_type:complete